MTAVTTVASASVRPMPRVRNRRRSYRRFALPNLTPALELALFVLTSALPTLMLATAVARLF